MASRPPAEIISGPRAGSRLAAPGQGMTPDVLGLVGYETDRQPPLGHLGSHGDVLLTQGRHPDGDPRPDRMGDDLEGPPKPVP